MRGISIEVDGWVYAAIRLTEDLLSSLLDELLMVFEYRPSDVPLGKHYRASSALWRQDHELQNSL